MVLCMMSFSYCGVSPPPFIIQVCMVVFCVILLWWPFYPHPTPPLIIHVCMVVLGVMSFSCCGGCLCQWPKCNPDVVCEPVCSDRGVRPWLQRCGHHLWAHAVCDWRHTGGERLLWHPLHAQRQGPAEWPQGGKGENPATQLPHLIPSLPFFLPSLNVCFVQMLDKLLKGEWRLGGSVMMGSRVWSAVKEMLIYYYLRNIDEYIYIYIQMLIEMQCYVMEKGRKWAYRCEMQ